MINRCGVGGIILFLLFNFSVNGVVGQDNRGKIKCICIDAGHGGEDPGSVGKICYEKHLTLNIALKLGKLIKEKFPDIKVVYTREKDIAVDLDKRGMIANKNNADLFVSIHINANELKSPHGLETYILGLHKTEENLKVAMKENASIKYEKDYESRYKGFDPKDPASYIIFSLLQNIHLKNSLQLAGFVQEEMVKNTKKTDRGVKQAGYIVLIDVVMPAILVEAGFISNAEEEKYLNTPAGQDNVALSIFNGIEKYKNSVEKSYNASENKKETPVMVEEDKKADEAGDLFYAVQVASAVKKIKNLSTLGVAGEVKELKTGGRYRYYVAESGEYKEVKNNLEQIKRKIGDCFIIAVYKGEIISVAEARKLEK